MTDVAHGRRILAVLPRGEALRNFVYSGVLDQVAARAAVSVWSIVPNVELWAALGSRYPDLSELHEIPERKIVGRLRDFVDMTHGRWLWSGAARNRWLTRDGEASTRALRVKRLAKKLACYPFANRPGLSALSTAERLASRWLRLGDDATAALRRMKPSLVFNASHVHGLSSAPLMRAAQSLGIPTATFIFSWDNLTSQGRLHTRYDHYLVWNEQIRAQLLWMYPFIRPEQVFVTGTPQFDFHFDPTYFWSREEFCARIGADPSRPIVLYTTSMARPVAGEERIVEGIARFVRGMKDAGSPQLLVRVYPKDRTGRFDDIKRRYPDVLFPKVAWEPNWLTPMPDDTWMLTNTLRHAALGINVASTVSLELCMFRKPVINVATIRPGSTFIRLITDASTISITIVPSRSAGRCGSSGPKTRCPMRSVRPWHGPIRCETSNRCCSTACSGTRWMENQQIALRKNSSSAPVCTRKRASSTLRQPGRRTRPRRSVLVRQRSKGSRMIDVSADRHKRRLLVLSHVLPFPRDGGQHQRVFQTLNAARDRFHVTFATIATANADRVRQELLTVCDDLVLLPSAYGRSAASRLFHRAAGTLYAATTGLKRSNYEIGCVEFSRDRIGIFRIVRV